MKVRSGRLFGEQEPPKLQQPNGGMEKPVILREPKRLKDPEPLASDLSPGVAPSTNEPH